LPPSPDDSVSLDIKAPPQRVYSLISDIRSMGRWSPETFRARWLRGSSGPQPGARFKGYNRWRGVIVWGTTAEVDVADPGREFTFTTVVWGARRTTWSYRFEAVDGGTRVTETRTELSNTWFRKWFQRWFMQGHAESYGPAMLTTLQRVKAAAERSTG
jgi:Polyketide cyclase / dehydrase and lipid transport